MSRRLFSRELNVDFRFRLIAFHQMLWLFASSFERW